MTNPTVSVPGIGRVLGLDLGERRIGVAVSDRDQRVALAATTVHRSKDRPREHRELARLVADYEAAGVVVGLPLSLSGAVGPAAKAALAEVSELASLLGVPIVTHDERFTTTTATTALRAAGRKAKQQRSVVDQVAAAVMLQSWIDGRTGGNDDE